MALVRYAQAASGKLAAICAAGLIILQSLLQLCCQTKLSIAAAFWPRITCTRVTQSNSLCCQSQCLAAQCKAEQGDCGCLCVPAGRFCAAWQPALFSRALGFGLRQRGESRRLAIRSVSKGQHQSVMSHLAAASKLCGVALMLPSAYRVAEQVIGALGCQIKHSKLDSVSAADWLTGSAQCSV